ncbi:hypothetical protein PspLS_07205 [Pyricularia sp. CBS 133598]|nr:hypothetical protein PspLS_07205 [Pyricularia sp. CBS 133598]
MDERGIFRDGLQVPKDQRALLDKRDAWAEPMKRTPQGLLNVPPDVIDDLKTFNTPKIPPAPVATSTPITWAEPRSNTTKGLLNIPPEVLDNLKTSHAQKIPSTPATASKPVTWAESMSKTPRGMLNVPPEIIESLTAFHAQKSAFATAATSSSQASLLSQEPMPTEPIPPSSSPPRETHQRRAAVTPAPLTVNPSSPQTDDACSPSDTPISGWSPSPPRNDRPRGADARVASPSTRTQALTPRTATNTSVKMRSKDSGPGPSSKRTAKSIVQSSTTALMSFPDEHESPPQKFILSSSSEADSEDEQMAVEEPLALAPAFQKSINKTAAPVAPTPPSAQIMPCTDQKNPQQQQEPKIKRRKMKNAVGLLDKCLGKIPDCDTLVQQAVPPRSTSFAKRRSETRTPVSRQSPRSQEAPSSSQTPQSDHDPAPHASQHAKITKELPRASDNLVTGSGPANRVTPQAELTPFEIFRKNYPDFTGSNHDFLRACISLQWLAPKNVLKVSLFDDFVRVFCHKYIEFAQSHDSAPSAIDYYNKDDEAIIYLNGVVDESFLKRVQAVYSAEIAALEAGDSVGDPAETAQVRVENEQASMDMEIDQPGEDSVADNAEENAGNHNTTTRSSPHQPSQPEEGGISDIEDDRFYRSSRAASPDLSTPVSHSQRNPMPQGDTHTQPKLSAHSTGSILDLTSSAASDVVIPNTSISVLDANPLRIPETVHKPRPRQRTESVKRPFRLIASLGNRDSPTSSMSSAQRKRRFSEYLAKNGQRSEA